jgi:hypothetical protein
LGCCLAAGDAACGLLLLLRDAWLPVPCLVNLHCLLLLPLLPLQQEALHKVNLWVQAAAAH